MTTGDTPVRPSKDLESFIEHLVLSLISVNAWPLEKSFAMMPALQQEGLFDLKVIRDLSHEEVFSRLERAGYRKSAYVVGLVVDRLQTMARQLDEDTVQHIHSILHQGSGADADAALLKLKGVGPTVLRNVRMLENVL